MCASYLLLVLTDIYDGATQDEEDEGSEPRHRKDGSRPTSGGLWGWLGGQGGSAASNKRARSPPPATTQDRTHSSHQHVLWGAWLAWAHAHPAASGSDRGRRRSMTRSQSSRRTDGGGDEEEGRAASAVGSEKGAEEGEEGSSRHGDEEEEEEEEVIADELVDKIEHAKKAAAYQSEFIQVR